MKRSTLIRWTVLTTLLAAAIGVTMWVGAPGAADLDHTFNAEEIRKLTEQAVDPEHAARAAEHLRGHLAEELPEQFDTFLKRLLVRALIVSHAPAAEIAATAAETGPRLPQQGAVRVMFYVEVANALLERGEAAGEAQRFAELALEDVPIEQQSPMLDAFVRGALGRAQIANGECEPAIQNLTLAAAAVPDSQPMLASLGVAYEQCGKPELAIRHYVRALGVYGRRDSSVAPALRTLYAAQHGSLKGLEAEIDKAYAASMNLEVFESRRFDRPAPPWAAEDLAGTMIRAEDHKGQIMVLDFWGSWCGPCRMELPHFQEIYEKYKDRGVVFYGVNWERVSREQRKAIAQAYMEQNGFDFPTVFDLEDKVSAAFQVESFPTVYMIDGNGQIRYRNIGFSEGIGEIMSLQLDALLKEQKAAGAKKK